MPGEDKLRKGHKYLCSNPNCKKVFSRPKIIKYQVCPACQTLVNMVEAENQGETPTSFAPKKSVNKKSVKLKKQKKIKADKSEKETLEVKPARVETPRNKLFVPKKKVEGSEKATSIKIVQKPQQGKAEMPSTQHAETLEAKAVSQTSSNCQYGFGYLNQREKGGQIPDMCMVCPRLLKCMLHDRYEKASVVETKKLPAT